MTVDKQFAFLHFLTRPSNKVNCHLPPQIKANLRFRTSHTCYRGNYLWDECIKEFLATACPCHAVLRTTDGAVGSYRTIHRDGVHNDKVRLFL